MLYSLLEDITYQNKRVSQARGKTRGPENGRITWKKGKVKSNNDHYVDIFREVHPVWSMWTEGFGRIWLHEDIELTNF